MKQKKNNSIYQNYQRNLIRATVSTNVGINNRDRLIKTYGEDVDRIEVLKILKRQSKFTIWWFTIFFVLGIVCLFLDIDGWFNVLDLFVVMVNIYLVTKGKASGIIIGIIECFLYAFVCLQTNLYGEIVKVLAICVPLNTVSLINWLRSTKKQKKTKYNETEKQKKTELEIRKLNKKLIIIYSCSAIFIAIGSYFLLKYVLNQNTALILGSISLTLMIVGKILTAQRYMESYIIFILGNIICLAMWVQTLCTIPFEYSTITMIVYQLACLTNDIFGYFSWKKMFRKVAINGGFILVKRKVNIKRIAKLKRQYRNLRWNKQVDLAKNNSQKNLPE